MRKPHANKPFPIGFFDNGKLKKGHIFLFDVLCRHLDVDDDQWIRTDAKTISRLLKQTSGVISHTPKKLLHTLQEFGYIQMPPERASRTNVERISHNSFLEILVLESAWDPKEIVRAHSEEYRKNYMLKRNAERKAKVREIQAEVARLLQAE